MKIIITGANGFIGRSCQRIAKSMGHNVTNISNKRAIFDDFSTYKALSDIECKAEYDLLIHCSAATPFNTKNGEIFEANRFIDKQLCDFILKNSVKQVVYLSTMAVYGKIKDPIINELTEINSPDDYGYSKFLGEQDLKEINQKKSFNLAILRLPGVVGKEMPNVFFRKLYESILKDEEVLIRSRECKFNNAVLDKDIYLSALNFLKFQVKNVITLNQHAKDIVTLGELIDKFSFLINKECIFKESENCNPPFLIYNKYNEKLLVKSNINKMLIDFHESYIDISKI